jgi:hypothetical protein
MKAHFPQLVCLWRGVRATWRGPVKPTGLSSRYTIKIDYSLGEAPCAAVIEPRLQPRSDGSPIPHVYPGNLPCLYLPQSEEWDATMHIAETIVPWICLWLFYYEIWHATGNWMGGGLHPPSKGAADRRS